MTFSLSFAQAKPRSDSFQNKHGLEDVVKQIPLTQGRVAIVDDEDAARVAGCKWHYLRCGYAHNSTRGYMHRVLLGAGPGERVDHVSGDKLDNRRANIRIATAAQNAANVGKREGHRSKFKGVTPLPWRGWMARIKNTYLGSFPTPELAARAYDRAALEHFGAFAKTNAMLGLLPVEAA